MQTECGSRKRDAENNEKLAAKKQKVDSLVVFAPNENMTIPDNEAALALARQIFSKEMNRKGRMPRRIKHIIPFLGELERKLRSGIPHELFNIICPVKTNAYAVADKATPHYQVAALLRLYMKKIIPNSLWGSVHNLNIILTAVNKFVSRRRREKMYPHEILHGFKITDCGWLASPSTGNTARIVPSDLKKRQDLMIQMIAWLFESHIPSLIKTRFHISEHAQYRNRLFYFRHNVWHDLSQPFMEQLQIARYELVDEEFLSEKKLDAAQVRFLPKAGSLRVITNMRDTISCKPGPSLDPKLNTRTLMTRSINAIMKDALKVLNFEKSRQKHIVGSSVTNMTEVLGRLGDYKAHVLKNHDTKSTFYMAKADIKTCFDSIKQDVMLDILDRMLMDHSYIIAKTGTFVAVQDQIAQVKAKTHHRRTRQELMTLLTEHIAKNTVKLGQRFYRQKVGIPQGSCLSTLLCSFYYGRMEKEELQCLNEDSDGLLLRYVDDFLYISKNRSYVETFHRRMCEGFPKYGCEANVEKSLTNLNGPESALQEFPWCGLFINANNLDVYVDYTRYGSCEMSDTLTVDYAKKPGEALLRTSLRSLKTKYHRILLNSKFNTHDAVLRNLFESVLLCAVKTATYCKELSRGRCGFVNEQFIFNIVISIARCTDSMTPQDLDPNQVLWFVFKAFHTAFRRHPSLFGSVLRRLKSIMHHYGSSLHVTQRIATWPTALCQ